MELGSLNVFPYLLSEVQLNFPKQRETKHYFPLKEREKGKFLTTALVLYFYIYKRGRE